MWRIIRLGLVLASLSLPVLGFAQSTNSGDITGTVTDNTGAALPGVTVTVLNVDTQVSRDFTTNGAGVYDTSSIVAGTYKITFSKTGFNQLVRSAVTVNVGTTGVDAQLAVGATTTQVVVNADIPLLQTESGAQGTTLEAETLAQLPQVSSIGQDWSSFNILMAGAAGAPGGAQGVVGSGTSNGTQLSVNGNLPFSTVLADGAETTLPASANSDINTQESIQEVQVLTSSFSAEYGIGGILYNQISKGGTNGFHGSAYEFYQSTGLNADNYAFGYLGQTGSPQVIHFHEYGGSIGGPIIKQKLFFFFNYEHIIDDGGTQPNSATIPTTAEQAGNFAGLPPIYDPATQQELTTGTYLYSGASTPTNCTVASPCLIRQQFHDNMIPSNRLDPVAKAIQAYNPASNTPGIPNSSGQITGNYTYTDPNTQPFTKYFGRLDYDVRPNNRITLSQTEGDNPGFSYGTNICPINCQTQDVSQERAQATDVWSIGSRITNEARFGYTNQLNFFNSTALNGNYPTKIGLQFAKVNDFPMLNIGSGFSNVVSSQSNAVYKEHSYSPSDVVTLVEGKHILHFGGELLMYENNSTAWGNAISGDFTYTGQYTQQGQGITSTGNAYADFLLGQTEEWSAKLTPEYGGREKIPQIFVQDDYKIRPNLTLNLGLRYQIQTGWTEVKGNQSSFDPTIENPATGTLGAMWYGVTHANGRKRLQHPVYDTLLPRIGASYQLDPLTIIRGGFGMFSYNWSNDQYGGGMGNAFGAQSDVKDQTNGVTPVVVLSSSGSNLPFNQAPTAPDAYNGQGVNYNQYHEKVGGSYQWNVQVQRQISNNLVASLGYVASHGHNLPFPVDINQVPESKLAPNDQALRPYPQFGSISVSGTPPNENAISNYNSLQAVIEKRMSQGVSLTFSYVWSHFLDDIDSSGWGSHAGTQYVQNSFVPSANYGNANFDIRNALKGDVIYELPFGRNKQFLNNNFLLDEVLGGWQLASTIIIQGGQPFTAVMGTDNSYSLAGDNFRQFPNVIGNPKLAGRSPKQWFNEAAFAVPAPGTFGNERRNQLFGPGYSRVNLGLGKTFAIWEQVHLQVRADANNAFNHPTFNLPTQSLTVDSTGAIATGTSTITSTTGTARTIQLSAHLTF